METPERPKRTPGIAKQVTKTRGPFSAPEDLFLRCDSCHAILQREVVRQNAQVCTECGHHFRIGAVDRLKLVADSDSLVFCDQELEPQDRLEFFDSKSYVDRIKASQKKTAMKEAFVSASGAIHGCPVELGAFEFSYMGGSMGCVVGEKVARIFDRALERKAGAVVFQASGGARMQEGILSLMQMAKTSASLSRLKDAGLPYISVLTDPTTGGVAASFAMLGDVHVAEPKALIGFAGPRVIQQTLQQKLPENFQSAEFLLEHGMIDAIVSRKELRSYLGRILNLLMK